MWQHVYPVNDIAEHALGGFECECGPEIDFENNIIIHNAFDGRDLIEAAEKGGK